MRLYLTRSTKIKTNYRKSISNDLIKLRRKTEIQKLTDTLATSSFAQTETANLKTKNLYGF